MWAYIISQFRYRFGRELGVIGGVALGTALFVTLISLGAGFKKASMAPLAGVAADLLITRPQVNESAEGQRTRGPRLPFGSVPFFKEELKIISKIEGIEEISTALEIWDFGANQYQIILGINPKENRLGPGRVLKEGLVSGRIFNLNEKSVTVVDRHYAAIYNIKPGDTVTIGIQNFNVRHFSSL